MAGMSEILKEQPATMSGKFCIRLHQWWYPNLSDGKASGNLRMEGAVSEGVWDSTFTVKKTQKTGSNGLSFTYK